NFLTSGGKSNVALGDSIYAALDGAHLPRVLAAFAGEAAVDLPDKLLSVIAALLIAQGLPERRGVAGTADLDLGEAVTFVVRSGRWPLPSPQLPACGAWCCPCWSPPLSARTSSAVFGAHSIPGPSFGGYE